METKEQITQNLLNDGNSYSSIGVIGQDGSGFTISSNPTKGLYETFNLIPPKEDKDFFMMTGLGGAVEYILTFQEQMENYKYND